MGRTGGQNHNLLENDRNNDTRENRNSRMLRDSYAGTWNKETVVNKSPANNEITVNMREQMFDEVKKIMKENQEQNKKEMQEFKSDMMTMFKTMIETLLDKDEEGNKEKKMISVLDTTA